MDTSNTKKLKKIHQEFIGEPNTSVDVKEVSRTQTDSSVTASSEARRPTVEKITQ